MRKFVVVGILIITIATAGLLGVMKTKTEEACAASDCNLWYTCIPRQCSQTVTYWDTWQECQSYKLAMGNEYKNCTCKRNWN